MTTNKEILEFREGEISLCLYCKSMTHSIVEVRQLVCGKCKRRKQ